MDNPRSASTSSKECFLNIQLRVTTATPNIPQALIISATLAYLLLMHVDSSLERKEAHGYMVLSSGLKLHPAIPFTSYFILDIFHHLSEPQISLPEKQKSTAPILQSSEDLNDTGSHRSCFPTNDGSCDI